MSEQDDLLAEAEAEADDLIDLTDTEDVSFSAAPDGWYVAECIQADRGTTKTGQNKGSPTIVLRFKLIDPESSRLVFKHAGLKGKSAGHTKILLRNLGLDVDSYKVAIEDCVGRQIRLYLVESTGMPGNNEIKKSEPYDGEDVGDVR